MNCPFKILVGHIGVSFCLLLTFALLLTSQVQNQSLVKIIHAEQFDDFMRSFGGVKTVTWLNAAQALMVSLHLIAVYEK